MKTACGEKMDLSPGMVTLVLFGCPQYMARAKGVYTAGVSDKAVHAGKKSKRKYTGKKAKKKPKAVNAKAG